MNFKTIAAAMLFVTPAAAHEWTPTYPELEKSYIDGVCVTTMTLFNRRQEVSYYEIGVYDHEWKKLPFATTDRIVKVGFLDRKTIDIYVKESDAPAAAYICSTSKILSADVKSTGIASRICSKIKH